MPATDDASITTSRSAAADPTGSAHLTSCLRSRARGHRADSSTPHNPKNAVSNAYSTTSWPLSSCASRRRHALNTTDTSLSVRLRRRAATATAATTADGGRDAIEHPRDRGRHRRKRCRNRQCDQRDQKDVLDEILSFLIAQQPCDQLPHSARSLTPALRWPQRAIMATSGACACGHADRRCRCQGKRSARRATIRQRAAGMLAFGSIHAAAAIPTAAAAEHVVRIMRLPGTVALWSL